MVDTVDSADLCKAFGELIGRMDSDAMGGCMLVNLLLGDGGARRNMSVVAAAVDGVEKLLSATADEDDVVGALGDLCGAANVTGATVYAAEIAGESAGELRAAYRWGTAIRRAGGEGLAVSRVGRWLARLSAGETIAACVKDLQPAEQAGLVPFGIRSVAAVPIVRDGLLTSVMVFEDTLNEHAWSAEDVAGFAEAGRVLALGLQLWGNGAGSAGGQGACEQLLADATDLAVKVVGRDCDVRFWNRGCEKLYGFSADEAIGQDVVDLIFPSETRQVIRQAIGQGFRTGAALLGGETRTIAKDGTGRSVLMSVHIVSPSGAGGEQLMYLIDVDLSAIMNRQDEKALLQRQLHGARKMETVSHLIGGVAHHFNNALTVIQGNAEIIRKSHAADEDLRELVEQILLATMVSSQLTSQLLSYSRLDNHAKMDVDVNALIESVVAELSAEIDPPPEIATDLRAAPATLEVDEKQLRSAMTNLGINAAEATAEGGQILVATEIVQLDEAFCASYPQEIHPGEYLCITVRDTGVGMDSQTLSRAFEPFFTTKPFGKGHGLGLASVYGCALSHNGAVDLTSEFGKGATVQLFLPLVQMPSDDVERQIGVVAKRGSVLIVDNEVSARHTLEEMLAGAGYEVSALGSGADAIKHYRTRADNIDLVVIDMNMPDLTGLETFRRLKEINPDVRGLLSSGLLLASDAQAILDEGAKGFLSKPYESAATMQQVARAVKE